ncbi:MAG: HAMP domain-containing histidine kinase [Oscillospiraceae bacterium]|nr:HAMP domain-containing histidine kinase [Oscillospiraceae bacterium]
MDKKNNADMSVVFWHMAQAAIVLIVALIAFLGFELTVYLVWGESPYIIGRSIWLALSMSLLVGGINYYLVYSFSYRYFSRLTGGIEKVSGGEFNVRIDEDNSGPFLDVFRNFNKMTAELQNAHTLRNDFINSYSHELKTPVSSINGFAELLLEGNISEDERTRYLRIIRDESARLAYMADGTILQSKLDMQQIIDNKEPYSLDEQLRKCGIILAPKWNGKHITLSGELDEVIYNGNEQMMRHLWLNLIGNAVKYTPEHGEISISLTGWADCAVVKVTDSGIGMNAETAARIFEKYYQAETVGARQGLGLGLSIARGIVELCEGTIEVESQENKGSTFTVTLPNKKESKRHEKSTV